VYTLTVTNTNLCEQESPKPEDPEPENPELENLELENLELENLEQADLANIKVPKVSQEAVPSLNLLDIVLGLNYTYEVNRTTFEMRITKELGHLWQAMLVKRSSCKSKNLNAGNKMLQLLQ
jgi:hypothetical protein